MSVKKTTARKKTPAKRSTPAAPAINSKLDVRRIAISTLKPAPYNPRTIDDASMKALESSLLRFGVVEPIIANSRNMTVVGGHQRLKVLQRQKITHADVVFVDLPEAEEKALNVALNSPLIAGAFTDDLAGLLAEIEATASAAFDDLRLGELLPDAPPAGSTEPQMGAVSYRVVIECVDENQQAELLDRFAGEGLEAKGLIV